MRSQRPGPRIAAAASLVALVVAPPAGATVPAPAPVLVSETVRSFQMANYPYPPEVTPLAIPLANGHRMIIHPGSLSLICHPSGNDNLIAGDVHPKFGECQALTTPARVDHLQPDGTVWNSSQFLGRANGRDIWNFTYDGAFGYAVVPQTPYEGPKLLVLRDNEHQNYCLKPGEPCYQGDATPARRADHACQRAGLWTRVRCGCDCCDSSTSGSTFINDWPVAGVSPHGSSYVSFVSLEKFDMDLTTGALSNPIDFGPVNWPASGFFADETVRTTSALAEPISSGNGHFTDLLYPGADDPYAPGGWVYAFFGLKKVTAATGCVGLGRAWLGSVDTYSPRAWRNWIGTDWATTPAVPADFRTADMADYYVLPPPHQPPPPSGEDYAASCVIDEPPYWTIWVNVAKLMKADGSFSHHFIAVEERLNADTQLEQLGLRYSASDSLTEWGPFTPIECGGGYGVGDPDCAKTGFGNLHYTYPTLYNASGTATGVVAANDFYVYGDHPFGNYQQKLLHLYVTNVPAP